MIIEENRRHHSESNEPTSSDEICLSDNFRRCPKTNNNNTIEETALVHYQPIDQQLANVDGDDGSGSSSSHDDEDEKDKNLVAQRSPQTTIKNKVSNADKTTITNKIRTEYHAATVKVVNKHYYGNNSLAHSENLDRIDVVPTEKTNGINKDPEANVEPKSSDTSSQPLCSEDKDAKWKWWTKKRLITISGAVLSGFAIIGILVLYFLISDSSDVCIISRQEWAAQPAKDKVKPLAVIPAQKVIIIHTKTARCFTKSQCSKSVQEIQRFDMKELNKSDIAYNWLVGGDSWVYHCRGWDVEGDHTKNHNNNSIGIGFIGTFKQDEPTEEQIMMGKKLIKKGIEEKHISQGYNLFGQRQCQTTESPGDKLYEIIRTWDHWMPACY